MLYAIIAVLVIVIIVLLVVDDKGVRKVIVGLGGTIVSTVAMLHHLHAVTFTGPIGAVAFTFAIAVVCAIFTVVAFFKK